MSIFDLTEQDIAAIRASTAPANTLAQQYHVSAYLIERMRPLGWEHYWEHHKAVLPRARRSPARTAGQWRT